MLIFIIWSHGSDSAPGGGSGIGMPWFVFAVIGWGVILLAHYYYDNRVRNEVVLHIDHEAMLIDPLDEAKETKEEP